MPPTNPTPNGPVPPQKSASTARSWKRAKFVDLELPSGNVARVRRVSMETFVASGMIPSSLLTIVSDQVGQKQGAPPPNQDKLYQKMLDDPAQLAQMVRMMDEVLVRTVVEPVCAKSWDAEGVEIPDTARDDDILYADEVDFEDKLFIFQWAVGGSEDLAQFRETTAADVASLHSGEDVGVSAE